MSWIFAVLLAVASSVVTGFVVAYMILAFIFGKWLDR